jgi:hypothetical protein
LSWGATSAVPVQTYESPIDAGTNFNAALADRRFSRAAFSLAAGSYDIGGTLGQSVTLGGQPLNSTVGGLKLELASAVPEPSPLALFAAGLGAAAFVFRRRA